MFSRAIVRTPGANYGEGLTTVDLGAPNYARALRQHELYCAALEKCGLTLIHIEKDERRPDATFVEDTAVLIPSFPNGRDSAAGAIKQKPARQQGLERADELEVNRALPDGRASAILTRPGAASRRGEVESIAEELSRFYSKLHSIHEPDTVDGGDVCEAGNHFFIGISDRTNEAGAAQLAKLLGLYGYTSSFVDIRDLNDILHLKSGLAYLGDNRLAVIQSLAHREEFQGFGLVRLNAGEEYAANCVRVNDWVLVAAGYPEFESALQRLGYKPIALEMTEFQKMDGGLSCLSLRL